MKKKAQNKNKDLKNAYGYGPGSGFVNEAKSNQRFAESLRAENSASRSGGVTAVGDGAISWQHSSSTSNTTQHVGTDKNKHKNPNKSSNRKRGKRLMGGGKGAKKSACGSFWNMVGGNAMAQFPSACQQCGLPSGIADATMRDPFCRNCGCQLFIVPNPTQVID